MYVAALRDCVLRLQIVITTIYVM